MKKIGLILLMFVPSMLIADTVTIDGIEYSCPSVCVITVSNGTYTVTDRDGGRITMIIK